MWEARNNIGMLGKVKVFPDFFTRDYVVACIERLPVSVSSIDRLHFLFFAPPAQSRGLVISPAGPGANTHQFTATLAAAEAR